MKLPIKTIGLLLAWASIATARAEATEQPNILWITAEDLSPQLGCYGDAYADTPRLDQLAEAGVRYTRFFAEAPVCAPSRATIITGMRCGPLGVSQMRSNHRIPDFVRPFTAYLREAGYYCVNNAKTDYNLSREAGGDAAAFIREGWDESSRQAHWRNCPEGKPFFCVFNYIDTHQSRGSRDDYGRFVQNVQARLSNNRIHDPAEAPLPPHFPRSAVARRTVARYYDCITTLDDFVAKTLEELAADGLEDDTIVFFFSDHGTGLPTGKTCVSTYGLLCPLIVSVPEKFRHLAARGPGSVSDRLVCFADLAPTVLRLAGLEVPAHLHGRAFLGEDVPEAPAYIFGSRDRIDETLATTRWITDGRYLLVRSYRRDVPVDQQTLISYYNSNGELCREIRRLAAAGRLSVVQLSFWSDRRPALRLFDGPMDPWNLRNLAKDPAQRERIHSMDRRLESHLLAEWDLGFWPEPELADAETKASAYDLARSDASHYPLERILETAKLEDPVRLMERLGNSHPYVRYWAVVGLAALPDDEVRPATGQVQNLLNDPSVSVRIEAASLSVRLAGSPAALDVLVRELQNPNEWAASRAARALERLGEKSRPVINEMRAALEQRSAGFIGPTAKGTDPITHSFQFSLEAALNRLTP